MRRVFGGPRDREGRGCGHHAAYRGRHGDDRRPIVSIEQFLGRRLLCVRRASWDVSGQRLISRPRHEERERHAPRGRERQLL